MRQGHERSFIRKLEPFQQTYSRALEQYERTFIRSGKLESAKEARQELERVLLWENVPTAIGEHSLRDPQLNSLLKNYEKAVLKVIPPIMKDYVDSLERLKKTYAQAGNLDVSLKLDDELSKVKSGKSLPVEAGRKIYLSSLSKEQFTKWLQKQSFDFSGTVGGFIKLKFENGKVIYEAGGNPAIYDYKVISNRAVEINGKNRGFTMKFSRDLQTGTFESDRGVYPVRINQPRKGKTE